MKFIYQKGMTLVELMIAMVISSFLMAGVFNVYLSIYSSDITNDHLSALQQNGRYAIEAMTRDIRMAGYTGCTSESTQIVNLVADGHVANFDKNLSKEARESGAEIDNSIVGWESASTGFADAIPVYQEDAANIALTSLSNGSDSAVIGLNVTDNSDVFQVWGAKGRAVRADSISNGVATADEASAFSAGDFVVLSNCEQKTVLAEVCSAAGTEVVINDSCNDNFGEGPNLNKGDLIQIFSSIYYVSRENGRSLPSLFRATLDNSGNLTQAIELAEGVENMQILYGLNTDEDDVEVHNKNYDVDVYAPAQAISAADWKNVVSVQVSLLMASVDDGVSPEPLTYKFNGVDNTPSDKRLRRVYTKTITLRNRAL